MGHEALSRGRAAATRAAFGCFGVAGRHGWSRSWIASCRYQTFQDWHTFGGSVRLFVNTYRPRCAIHRSLVTDHRRPRWRASRRAS